MCQSLLTVTQAISSKFRFAGFSPRLRARKNRPWDRFLELAEPAIQMCQNGQDHGPIRLDLRFGLGSNLP